MANSQNQETVLYPGQFSLNPATPPDNAANVNNVPAPNVPTVSPYIGNIFGATGSNSYYNSLLQTNMDIQNDTQQRMDAPEQNVNQAGSFLQNLFKENPANQATAGAWNQVGFSPKEFFANQKAIMAESETLTKEYNKIQSARDAELARAEENPNGGFGEGYISSEQARIDKKYAPRLNELSANINAKSAYLEALEGNFERAQTFVNQAVEAATADFQFKYNAVKTFYDINQDAITRLDSKYQNAMQNAISIAKDQYDQARQDARAKGDLLLEAAKLGIGGISMNDSLESIYSKISAGAASGTNISPEAQNWADLVLNGQSKIESVPKQYKNQVAQIVASSPNEQHQAALEAGQKLLGYIEEGKAPVGRNAYSIRIPGTKNYDFVQYYKQLKSLLSLGNVKLLKGQGSVSDAERKLLAESATALQRPMSPEEFKTTVQKIVNQLSGGTTTEGSSEFEGYTTPN